jgi:trk system potassium uptake protein TrkH
VGKRFSLKNKIIIQEDINYFKLSSVLDMTKYIIYLTFTMELVGAILLYLYFKNLMPGFKAWFFAVFHAISAFNNAGIDLFGNSLEGFYNSIYINIVFSFLFISGGLGFIVISEIYTKSKFTNLTLHAKMVIVLTFFLIILPFIFILFLEFNNPATIGNLSFKGKLLGAFFQAVTPRTAGFNTIPIGSFRDVTLFLMIILMFIGASPGSTGGGVKTTTIGTLFVVVYNMALGKKDMEIFKARLGRKDIYKALTIVVLSLALVAIITLILSITEEFSFIVIIFEVFSAFGTVGLSTGITARLSTYGRLFIILIMFIGRVGPFTIAMAIGKRRISNIRYPEEDILIG